MSKQAKEVQTGLLSMKSQKKNTDFPPYILYDQDEYWNVEEMIQVQTGAFPPVTSSMNKGAKIFVRFNQVPLDRIIRSEYCKKISYKMRLVLSDAQIAVVRKIETAIKLQLKDRIVQRKLLSDYVIQHHFKSNLDNHIFKITCGHDRSAFHSSDGIVAWPPNEELPDKIAQIFSPETVLEYVCVEPDLIWVAQDATFGISWNMKSANSLLSPEEDAQILNLDNIDCSEFAEIDF